jgi:hypothetical protein
MIFTTIGCAAATWGPPATFIGVFAMWRFLLGIGIGGDYPLSAVITSGARGLLVWGAGRLCGCCAWW